MPTTVPVPKTFTSTTLTASDLNTGVRDPLLFALNKPVCRVRSNATQSVTTATFTSLNFQVEDVDDDPDGTGGHSTVTNTSRFTARYPGQYRVSGGVTFAASATGRRGIRLAKNGSVVDASGSMGPATAASTPTVGSASELVFLNEGDYVEVQGFQDSGGSLNAGSASAGESNNRMNAVWESN